MILPRDLDLDEREFNINRMDAFFLGRLFDGTPFFQGDIILDHRTRSVVQGGFSRRRRAVKRLSKYRWPGGIIPYTISKDIGKCTATTFQEFFVQVGR